MFAILVASGLGAMHVGSGPRVAEVTVTAVRFAPNPHGSSHCGPVVHLVGTVEVHADRWVRGTGPRTLVIQTTMDAAESMDAGDTFVIVDPVPRWDGAEEDPTAFSLEGMWHHERWWHADLLPRVGSEVDVFHAGDRDDRRHWMSVDELANLTEARRHRDDRLVHELLDQLAAPDPVDVERAARRLYFVHAYEAYRADDAMIPLLQTTDALGEMVRTLPARTLLQETALERVRGPYDPWCGGLPCSDSDLDEDDVAAVQAWLPRGCA